MKKIQQAQQMKQLFDEQVQNRRNAQNFAKSSSLSAEEVEYNRKIIKKIESDPRLYKEVMARVKPTPRGGMGEFKYG